MQYFDRERAEERLSNIQAAVYRESRSLGPLQFRSASEPEGDEGGAEAGVGHTWDQRDGEETVWFRGSVAVPAEWAGERVALRFDFGNCTPLLYLDDAPYQALDEGHDDVLLHDPATGGETHDFAVECHPLAEGSGEFRAAELVRLDRTAEGLYYDLLTAIELADVLAAGTPEHVALMTALDAAVDALDSGDAFLASLPAARAALREGFFDRFTEADPERDPEVLCAGHAPLDLVPRALATAARWMAEYPEYHFTQASPQQLAHVRELSPGLWERLKARAAEGRFEPTGGVWVEPDLHVPSGESLLRQFFHGQRFLEQEFGRRATAFLDTAGAGASAALPQILAGFGIRAFLTTGSSGSPPADTFTWRGIDGTEVLAHRAPSSGDLTPARVKETWDAYRQKPLSHELLRLVGGGSGPTRRMLEVARRLRAVPGLPRCSFGAVEPFLTRLAGRVEGDSRLPRRVGELLPEGERGVAGPSGRVARLNRLCEVALRNAEVFSVLAEREAGVAYPKERLDAAWLTLLRSQTRDVLSGAGSPEDAARAAGELEGVLAKARAVTDAALDAVAAKVTLSGDAVVVFNPTDTLRPSDVARVTVPPTHIKAVEFADENDAPLPAQLLGVSPGGGREYLVLLNEVGALGYQTLTVGKPGGPAEESSVRVALAPGGNTLAVTLENEFVRAAFDARGELVSLVHKIYADEEDQDSVTEREVLAPGRTGNALVAWGERAHPLRDAASDVQVKIVEKGPVRAGLEISRRFRESTVTQRIYLYAHSPRLEFHTEADWRERGMRLTAEFPVAVNAFRATFEMAHGAVERPTHRDIPGEASPPDAAAHRWLDLSEGDYGVSILNNGACACDVWDNVLRLTLLTDGAPLQAEAGRERHPLTYSLLPHTGDWRSETVDEAFALNYPLITRFVPRPTGRGAQQQQRDLPARYELATVNDQGIVIDAIKRAEDGNGVIVRLYEAFNTRGTATLTVGFDVAEAFAVGLMEGNPQPVEVRSGGDIAFAYRPHEVKTFRLIPG